LELPQDISCELSSQIWYAVFAF